MADTVFSNEFPTKNWGKEEWDHLYELCATLPTDKAIAEALGMSVRLFRHKKQNVEKFKKIYHDGRVEHSENIKDEILTIQMAIVRNTTSPGSTTLAIYLGKVLCGQREGNQDSGEQDDALNRLVASMNKSARAALRRKKSV